MVGSILILSLMALLLVLLLRITKPSDTDLLEGSYYCPDCLKLDGPPKQFPPSARIPRCPSCHNPMKLYKKNEHW